MLLICHLQYRTAGEWGPAGAGETRPDMRRLLNPTASMIATAATLTGLAAAAGVPATTAMEQQQQQQQQQWQK
jgi:hypothetical protein